jgi:hypothetical protein
MGITLKTTPRMAKKKEKSRVRLAEKYYGKKDILATWEACSKKASPGYLRDLRKRIRTHQNDLAYRGMDDFTDLANNIDPGL